MLESCWLKPHSSHAKYVGKRFFGGLKNVHSTLTLPATTFKVHLWFFIIFPMKKLSFLYYFVLLIVYYKQVNYLILRYCYMLIYYIYDFHFFSEGIKFYPPMVRVDVKILCIINVSIIFSINKKGFWKIFFALELFYPILIS